MLRPMPMKLVYLLVLSFALAACGQSPLAEAPTSGTASPEDPELGKRAVPAPMLRLLTRAGPGYTPTASRTDADVLAKVDAPGGSFLTVGVARDDGSACIGVLVTVEATDGSVACYTSGGLANATATQQSVPGSLFPGRIFGSVPSAAEEVLVTAPGRASVVVPAFQAGADWPGLAFFNAEWTLTPGTTIRAMDPQGRELTTVKAEG